MLFTVQKALPLPGVGASVILTSSTNSIKGTAAPKAAVRYFVRSWILGVKDRGIRINAISSDPILPPGLTDLAGTPEEKQALLDYLRSQIPLGRLGDPDEIAKVAVFLACDDSSFVNGTELFADGALAQV